MRTADFAKNQLTELLTGYGPIEPLLVRRLWDQVPQSVSTGL